MLVQFPSKFCKWVVQVPTSDCSIPVYRLYKVRNCFFDLDAEMLENDFELNLVVHHKPQFWGVPVMYLPNSQNVDDMHAGLLNMSSLLGGGGVLVSPSGA